MLSKMETIYLGLLRGFILVAATLALVAAAILIATAIPSVLTRMGVTQSQGTSHTLADFITEQKPNEQSSDNYSEAEIPVDPIIAEAAANFHGYLGARATTSRKQWEQGLQGLQSELPAPAMRDYAQSVLALSKELKTSRGKSLTEKRVFQLVEWHQKRFAANFGEQLAERAAADAAFKFQIAAAFGALLLFVFITFIFLFVRIERNLRVVRVAQADGHA